MHSILLVGAALVGLPILLHLIMKQEPKRLPFPAFRFLRQKLKTNQRKLRLRHFILLALRMLLIALFCLALYQPTVYSDRVNLFRGEQPVAVVLVIDTSPSMGYTVGDKTRLDEARRRALELLDELPDRSRVAVIDTADPGGDWLPSVSDARRRLNELKEPKGIGPPVTSALATAYQLLKTVDQETESAEPMPRLVAVFTDRAAACWDPARVDDLKKLRDSVPDPKPTHAVVDVGVDQPTNVSILSAEMRPQVIPANQPAVITVTVAAVGPDVEAVVRCKLDTAAVPERKVVQLPGGQTRAVTFEFRDLKPGLHQVDIGLETPDNLMADNARFLTFRTAEARKILTIADDPDDAAFWKLAHDAKGDFDCDVLRPEDVKADTLARFEAVCLLGVAHPNRPEGDPLWAKLQRYVEGGGKLVVIPGGKDRMALDEYDPKVSAANFLLPGKFTEVTDTREAQPDPKEAKTEKDRRSGVSWVTDDERALQHPMLRDFKKWKDAGNIDFVRTPRKAWKYWKVEPNTAGGSVVVRYDDADDPAKRSPAVLERAAGKGRVLMLTTRMDAPPKEQEWHDYWQTEGNTWNVVFPWLVVRYLVGDTAEETFNHPTGATVTVPLARLMAGQKGAMTISGPGVAGTDAILKPAEKQTELRVGPPRTLTPGNFRLAGPTPGWEEGYSLNVPAEESQLDKVPAEGIEDLTGPNSVIPVGKDLKLWDVLTKTFNQPVDLFPWLLIAVLVLLAAEGVVANRFYRRPR